MTSEEMDTLKEAIRQKYESYRSATPTKYPHIKFNSYPNPYEHLQESMRAELFKLGGPEAKNATETIPSARIFAKIFHEGYILKEEKLLDSCYLYTQGVTRATFHKSLQKQIVTHPENIIVPENNHKKWLVNGAVILGLFLTIITYFVIHRPIRHNGGPSLLTLKRPLNGQIVPMKAVIEGSVTNADTIWPVVCDVKDTIYHAPAYYVQNRIPVKQESKIWKGEVQIGGRNKQHIGANIIIRVFANPKRPLIEGERLYAWPQAELSSESVHVVRGYYRSDFADGLTIEQPVNHQVVPMKVLIEGKVTNADVVWPVVHGMPNGGYYVQAPGQVDKSGKWRGPIYFGGLDKSSVGSSYQIRVFVNPSITLKEGDEIRAWPEAELSSAPVEVVRGSKK